MTGILVGVIIGTTIFSFLSGMGIGVFIKHENSEYRKKIAEQEKKLFILEHNLKAAEENSKIYKENIEEYQRKIAEINSSEIIITKEFSYESSMENNLKRIKEFLGTLDKSFTVIIHIEKTELSGSWKKLAAKDNNKDYSNIKCVTTFPDNWCLKGSPNEVMDEIEFLYKDPANGYYDKDKNKWRLDTQLGIIGRYEVIPNKDVEDFPLIIIEKEIVEIEKPVFVEDNIPEIKKEKLPKDIEDLIAAKIEVELASRNPDQIKKEKVKKINCEELAKQVES